MWEFLARTAITALTLLLVAEVIPGIEVDSLTTALIAAFVLGILNAIVRPILIFFTLPITILTLGLFIFVINALLFLFVASFVQGFSVSGFWTGLFGSLIVSIVSSAVSKHEK
jgi:putative membrane protein